MSNYSPKTYSCSHCSYHTTRKYNLERHTILVHNISHDCEGQNVNLEGQNVNLEGQNVNLGGQNVNLEGQNVNLEGQNVNLGGQNVNPTSQSVNIVDGYKCKHCYKVFSHGRSLSRHMTTCKGVQNPCECPFCHAHFASRQSLCKHKKVCKGSDHEEHTGSEPIAHPTNITNNNYNNGGDVNNINVTNIHVMNFPKGIEDQDFRFYKGHISEKRFKKLVTNCKPMTAFRNYARELLSHEANHVAFKTSPNVKYSKVKREDGWEFEQDSEVIPVLTYHASCSALEDTHAAFENAKTNPQSKSFVQVLDDINTENDENTNYEDANDSVKFCIINTSLRSRLKP
jgi:hypothetical protein